jgi:RNA polymerase sigma factor (sigma-70 family)
MLYLESEISPEANLPDATTKTQSDAAPSPFDRVLAEHGAALARLASSYTRTAADRDDLLQEIAIALWRAWPKFRGECSERTFLFRVAHNRAISHVCRRRVPASVSEEDVVLRDPHPGVDVALVQAERRERLLDAVRRLPLGHREVVTLTLEGLDYGEIATVLGISESNVGVRLTRARQQLRVYLEGK